MSTITRRVFYVVTWPRRRVTILGSRVQRMRVAITVLSVAIMPVSRIRIRIPLRVRVGTLIRQVATILGSRVQRMRVAITVLSGVIMPVKRVCIRIRIRGGDPADTCKRLPVTTLGSRVQRMHPGTTV